MGEFSAFELARRNGIALPYRSVDASWLPPEEKRALRSRLDRFVASEAGP